MVKLPSMNHKVVQTSAQYHSEVLDQPLTRVKKMVPLPSLCVCAHLALLAADYSKPFVVQRQVTSTPAVEAVVHLSRNF
jgi:hypothetical protein